ncbi:MAG: hypothetical protein LBT88_04110 [Oscillospiraceae bacterium]|nr:hypothetical protein [Oscillospiraceae bacterium]
MEAELFLHRGFAGLLAPLPAYFMVRQSTPANCNMPHIVQTARPPLHTPFFAAVAARFS